MGNTNKNPESRTLNLEDAPAPFQLLFNKLDEQLDIGWNHLEADGIYQVYQEDAPWLASYAEGADTLVLIDTNSSEVRRWPVDDVDALVEAIVGVDDADDLDVEGRTV